MIDKDSYAGKTVLIADLGQFADLSTRLARDEWGRVLYWAPWKKSAPETKSLMLGNGLEGVERVRDFFEAVEESDLIVFPDCYQGDLQVYLEKHNKRVWGSRKAERMEFMREEFKSALKKVGLPVAPYKVIKGISRLREYLTEHDDQIVKMWGGNRGDGETFDCPTYILRKSRIDALEYSAGPFSEQLSFVVESKIESDSECGYDGICIDGQFTDGMVDYEVKNRACLAAFKEYKDMADAVREVNEAFAPLLKQAQYRSALGTEIRVDKKGTPFFIDLTARFPCPPGATLWEMCGNLSDILWRGSAGEFVQFEPVAKYGCEIMLYLDWEDREWQEIYIPDKVRQWVKLFSGYKVGGIYYPISNEGRNHIPWSTEEIGAVVGIGNTIEEAIDSAKEHAAAVEGFKVSYDVSAVAEALEQAIAGEEKGIAFSEEKIPAPESVLSEA